MHSENTTIRLVAVDMDGTLLHDDKSISDYTLDVLRKIVKKGVILVPASGRPIGGMKEAVLNNVDGIQYAICSNGAMLMDVPEEKSICETGISTEKAVEAIAYLEQFPVAVYVHTDRGTFRAEAWIEFNSMIPSPVRRNTIPGMGLPFSRSSCASPSFKT